MCISNEPKNRSNYFKDAGGIWEKVKEGHDHKVSVVCTSLAGWLWQTCRRGKSLTAWDPPESWFWGGHHSEAGEGRRTPRGKGVRNGASVSRGSYLEHSGSLWVRELRRAEVFRARAYLLYRWHVLGVVSWGTQNRQALMAKNLLFWTTFLTTRCVEVWVWGWQSCELTGLCLH